MKKKSEKYDKKKNNKNKSEKKKDETLEKEAKSLEDEILTIEDEILVRENELIEDPDFEELVIDNLAQSRFSPVLQNVGRVINQPIRLESQAQESFQSEQNSEKDPFSYNANADKYANDANKTYITDREPDLRIDRADFDNLGRNRNDINTREFSFGNQFSEMKDSKSPNIEKYVSVERYDPDKKESNDPFRRKEIKYDSKKFSSR